MRIVHGNAIEQHAAAEDRVPGGFETRSAATPVVVHHRVPAEDLEQLVVADLPDLVGRQGPAEVGVIDVRHSAFTSDRIDTLLRELDQRRARLRSDLRFRIEAVDVDGLVAQAVGHLFPFDDDELARLRQFRVETIDGDEDVVVGDH